MASTSTSLSDPTSNTIQLPRNSSGAQGHLLNLATETLHQICRCLKHNDDSDALANLRMTCRGLKSIPEEYLFDTIYLDRRFDSLQGLVQFSFHQHLRQYVTRVQVELEPVFERLSRVDWDDRVKSYGTGILKSNDDTDRWTGKPTYDEQLARERDALAEVGITKCWERFKDGLSQQDKLKTYSVSGLMDILEPAFARFDDIQRFSCDALSLSKYALGIDDSVGLRKTPRETLTYPPLCCPPNDDDQEYLVTYATVCINSLLQSGAALNYFGLLNVPWDVLVRISESWRSPASMPYLGDLCTLTLSTLCCEDINSSQKAKGMATVSQMLSQAEGLTEFDWLHGPETFGLHPNLISYLCLPDAYELAAPSQLHKVEISGVSCKFHELQNFLVGLPSTLPTLHLQSTTLENGYWVDIFDERHSTLVCLKNLDLGAPLFESDHWGSRFWVWEPGLDRDKVQDCLLLRLQDYITQKTITAPLLSTAKVGSPDQWESVSDKSMAYRRLD